MSTDWFNDRPLHIETICTRLREAVEEREAFFRFDPEKTAKTPLTLPSRPYSLGNNHNRYANFTVWQEFIDNLSRRIRTLARFVFAPDNLGKFSEFNPSPGRNAHESIYCSIQETDVLLESLEIDPADFWMRKPHRFMDMKFFNACAELLNRYILYPQPPHFKTSTNTVFGWDCYLSVTDLVSGNVIARNFQPDGSIKFTGSSGSYGLFSGENIAKWQKNDYRAAASGHRLYYDHTLGSGTDSFPFTGEFQLQLSSQWSEIVNQSTTASEICTTTYTITPGGSVPMHIPDQWQQRIPAVLAGQENASSASVTVLPVLVRGTATSPRIKLTAANIPPLPYKYLNKN